MPSATVLSICPFETVEIKPIIGGYFKIPAAPKDDFILVDIFESSYIQRMPATDHNIVIPVAAHHIAKALVDDFVNTVVESSDGAGPGMMWFDVKITRPEVLSHHKIALDALKAKQQKWFENLCRKADDDWNQFHRLGLISDHQRYAARHLGYKAEWIADYAAGSDGLADCPVCYSRIDSRAAKCLNCGAILDRAKAAQFGILISGLPETVVSKPVTPVIKA